MPAFVALLRGINVGQAKRVAMADWRAMLSSSLGYERVGTLLNSGNAVFCAAGADAAQHAADIARALADELHVQVPVVVKSAAEIETIVAENPLAATAPDPSRLLLVFAQDRLPLESLARVSARVKPPEQFAIGRDAAYLHCPGGILKSEAGEALLGKVGSSVTTRNWATVLKIQALLQACDAGERAPAGKPSADREDPRLQRLSTICLSLPEATRGARGDHFDFRVRGKVFAYFLNNHHGDGIVSVCVKSELGENVDRAGRRPELYYLPAYIGKRGWFGMRLDRRTINWSDVQNIVELSWRLAAPKALLARFDAGAQR